MVFGWTQAIYPKHHTRCCAWLRCRPYRFQARFGPHDALRDGNLFGQWDGWARGVGIKRIAVDEVLNLRRQGIDNAA